MIYERVTRDGRRELRIDDRIYEVPHEHEIAPDALFPKVARQSFTAGHVADGSGQAFMWGKLHLAAVCDLLTMKEHLTSEVGPVLDQAINLLVETAIQSTPLAAVEAMSDQLAEAAAIRVEPTVGPEADDELWYRGAVKASDVWERPRAATSEERARARSLSPAS